MYGKRAANRIGCGVPRVPGSGRSYAAHRLAVGELSRSDGRNAFYSDDSGEWEFAGDDWWLPPTDEGLANSQWSCGEDWYMELGRGNCDPDYTGIADLYYRFEDGQEYQLFYSGVWRMEGDCLRLELSAGVGTSAGGSFPVLIAPSGDYLQIQKSRDGYTCPPFFDDDMTFMELTRIYG